ncbi:hypothetical protein FKW77_005370 [Venturia effusa]|uniref:Uncharacterized protein n=1 Tax=Venturia effusa TaxID=50376 RepID=A0A517KWD7_9PEZI|nr:hypothetical protein FKW77_005370 [Venturia effusa]
MRASSTLIALFAALATALPAAEPEAAGPTKEAPNPHDIRIDGLKLSGSGCPQGSVAALLSENGQVVTIGYDKYIAATGPDIAATEARKNCQVFFNLFYPQGWSYTIATSDFRGYVDQEHTCSTTLGVTNFFSGDQQQVTGTATIRGKFHDNYIRTAAVATGTTVHAKCGAKGPTFVSNSQVYVKCTDKKESAMASVDSQVAKFEIKYNVHWKKCP